LNKVVLVLLALTAVSGVGVLSWNNFDIDLQPFQIFSSFDQFDDSICTCADLQDGSFDTLNCNAFDGVPYSDPNGLCTMTSSTTNYGSPGENLSAQGCGVGFWKNNYFGSDTALGSDIIMWPEGYSPDYYFNDIYHTTISQPQSLLFEVAENEVDEIEVAENEVDEIEVAENEVDEIEVAENEDSLNTSEEDEVETESISEQEVIQDDEEDRGPTLLEALNARGGDMNALLRHSVAALLNAAHPDIDYPYSVVQVLDLTQISIINEDYQTTIDLFEKYNEDAEKPSICY